MNLRLLPPDALPGVAVALAWLLGMPATDGAAALAAARESGLLITVAGESWRVDGDMLARLADAAWARLPTDDGALAVLLDGLGDLRARSHARLFEPLCAALRDRGAEGRLEHVLASAIEHEPAPDGPVDLAGIAIAQWLTRARPTWATFTQAISYRNRGYRFPLGHRYGLSYLARVVLMLDARAADACIAQFPDHFALTAIGSAAVEMARPLHGNRFGAALVRSATPAVRYLGAAVFICPYEDVVPGLDFAACRAALLDGGVASNEATWLMGMRTKRALLERNRRRSYAAKTEGRIQQLERKPDTAFGGVANAGSELERTRRDHAASAEKAVTASVALDAIVDEWAARWPAAGLAGADLEAVDQGLATDPLLRHRLAAALSHAGNRDWLSKGNIATLRAELCLVGDRGPPAEHVFPDETRFANLADGAAASLFLLAGADVATVARQSGQLVFKATEDAAGLLRRPYAAARTPARWQFVMTRALFACRFALVVAGSAPEGKRDAVARLNREAIDCARRLLSCRDLVHSASESFLRLAGAAVQAIARLPAPQHDAEEWALDTRLPAFPRALALWSSPTLVPKHLGLARELFLICGEPPLSRFGDAVRFTELAYVLDAAVAVATRTGDHEIVREVVRLWPDAFRPWQVFAPDWADTAEWLAAALSAEGSARDALRVDPTWASSYCRQLVG